MHLLNREGNVKKSNNVIHKHIKLQPHLINSPLPPTSKRKTTLKPFTFANYEWSSTLVPAPWKFFTRTAPSEAGPAALATSAEGLLQHHPRAS